MITTLLRADELIPGDRFDTHCGLGLDRFRLITRVRLEENNRPGGEDRIEITFDTDAISNTRTFRASSLVHAIAG